MAGGGFANHAMNVVKANRALLKKRKIRSRSDVLDYTAKTEVRSKHTTPGQMRAVKLQAEANRKRNLILWLITIGSSLLILAAVYFWLS